MCLCIRYLTVLMLLCSTHCCCAQDMLYNALRGDRSAAIGLLSSEYVSGLDAARIHVFQYLAAEMGLLPGCARIEQRVFYGIKSGKTPKKEFFNEISEIDFTSKEIDAGLNIYVDYLKAILKNDRKAINQIALFAKEQGVCIPADQDSLALSDAENPAVTSSGVGVVHLPDASKTNSLSKTSRIVFMIPPHLYKASLRLINSRQKQLLNADICIHINTPTGKGLSIDKKHINYNKLNDRIDLFVQITDEYFHKSNDWQTRQLSLAYGSILNRYSLKISRIQIVRSMDDKYAVDFNDEQLDSEQLAQTTLAVAKLMVKDEYPESFGPLPKWPRCVGDLVLKVEGVRFMENGKNLPVRKDMAVARALYSDNCGKQDFRFKIHQKLREQWIEVGNGSLLLLQNNGGGCYIANKMLSSGVEVDLSRIPASKGNDCEAGIRYKLIIRYNGCYVDFYGIHH